jgi:putative DNA primase/helicase
VTASQLMEFPPRGRQRSRTKRDTLGPIRDTDLANARRLAERHGDHIRFTPERGWLTWDSKRWAVDEKQVAIQALAKDTAASIFGEVQDAPAGDRDAIYQHAKRSQSRRAIEAMVCLARSEPGVLARLVTFDADGWLFNVANGTVNLRTGELHPHRREDLISNLSDVTFDRNATCPLWESFLRRVTDDSDELTAYLRRFVGHLLIADTSEQTLHFLFGLGANGKSVFCEVLMRLLGEYAITVSPDLILLKRHGGIPNDVARLRGKRAALMNETGAGTRFDEAKLKDLTGGDALSARFLHQEFFDFAPSHRIVIRGNHKPAISGTDEGIWRRLRLVPFTVTIPEGERDQQLLAKLQAELPGILNWATRGCMEWQREGLCPPPIVVDAVKSYREESDILGRFIDERCDRGKLHQVQSSAFFSAYQRYCEQASERWTSSKDLPGEMERRGYAYKRTMTGRLFLGISLKQTAETRWGDDA